MSLDEEYMQFVERFLRSTSAEKSVLLDMGKDLAHRLHEAGVSLCYNKATEFSPDIECFFLYAAEVAFLVYGKGSPALVAFEKDVHYYKDFKPPSSIVAEYESFCANHPSSGVQHMSTNSLGSTTITQVGIIVHNIEETAQAWAKLLGVPAPGIIVTDSYELTHAEYQGQPTHARAKLAFFPLGQVTLELIEPIGEPSTWRDQLVDHGQSLHHIAFEIKGMAQRLEILAEHGLPLLQSGEYQGGRYAYLDGQQQYGAFLELLEND